MIACETKTNAEERMGTDALMIQYQISKQLMLRAGLGNSIKKCCIYTHCVLRTVCNQKKTCNVLPVNKNLRLRTGRASPICICIPFRRGFHQVKIQIGFTENSQSGC